MRFIYFKGEKVSSCVFFTDVFRQGLASLDIGCVATRKDKLTNSNKEKKKKVFFSTA